MFQLVFTSVSNSYNINIPAIR